MIALDATIEVKRLEEAFKEAPRIMYSYFRGGVLRMIRGYRKDFLAASPVKLSKARSSADRHAGLGRTDQWPIKSYGRTLDDLRVNIGTKSGVAAVLEKGSTIKGARGSLAIPLSRTYKTPAQARAKGAKLFPRTTRGRTILFEQRGSTIVPVFVLVPSVTIRPQLQFFRGWDSSSAQEARVKRLSEELNRGLRRVFGEDAVKEGAG